jgi:uncharacterized membrane protein HdeD (DUF308 family)
MKEAKRRNASRSRPEHVRLSQRYWWLLTQGICAVIFGILAIWVPQTTIFLFLRLFGIYAFIDGLIPVIHVLISRRRTGVRTRGQWILLVEGIVGLACGLFFLILPKLQTAVLVYTIAVWLLVKGISFVTQARRKGWLMALSGLLALLAGIYLFVNPTGGLNHVLRIVGAFALVVGALLIVRGLRAKRVQSVPWPSEQV